MGFSLFVLPLLIVFVLSSGISVFADTTYEITIPSGASDPGAPYFWSEKTTGITTGVISVFPGDTVVWFNGDTAFHTVTSVSRSGENILLSLEDEDGLFDSGFFTAGKSYEKKFDELGIFYYYCSLHPWMHGVVYVTNNPGSVQSIDGVASGYSDDGLGFEVKYILDTDLQNTVHIDTDESTLTFTISGDTENEQIVIILPPELIENPNSIWVDDVMVDFKTDTTAMGNKLTIPIETDSKKIKIMGTHVIPEFGLLAMGVLSIGLFSTLFLIRSKFSVV